MALGGEIGSMYVRIRPDVRNFSNETSTSIKKSLVATQAELDATARANVASASETLTANRELVTSYARVERAVGSTVQEQRIARDKGLETSRIIARSAGATASEVVDAASKEAIENIELAKSYEAIAIAAKHGSEAELVATQMSKQHLSLAAAAIGQTAAQRRFNEREGRPLSGVRALFSSAGDSEKELEKATRGALAGSGAFEHLGRSLAFASGGFLIFASGTQILHDSLAGAAQEQKSIEVIRENFGSAAQSVVNFGEKAAGAFGISAGAADATSARFAILFKNLGINTQEAAGMTLGYERLAGSLERIKGVDPTEVLTAITTAAAGNTRGLQQLGISITQTAVKQEALKLGLISTIHQALDPATRAEATYALATSHLGLFMLEAQKHTHDFANVQRTLSAEFSNVKDTLGRALLPIFSKYGGELANFLQRMQESGRLQRDFNEIAKTTVAIVRDVARAIGEGWRIFQTAAGWVGGTKHAIEILLGVLAVSKLAAIGKGFVGVANDIKGIGKAAEYMLGKIIPAFAATDAAAVATAETIDAALISTGFGAVVVAAGIMAAYVITHLDKVKRWFTDFGHWLSGHATAFLALPVIGGVVFMVGEVIKHFNAIKAAVEKVAHFVGQVFGPPVRAIIGLFNSIENAVKSAFSEILHIIKTVIDAIPNSILGISTGAGSIKAALDGVVSLFAVSGDQAGNAFMAGVQSHLTGLPGILATAGGTVTSFFSDLGKKIKAKTEVKPLTDIVPLKIQLELARARTPEATKRALEDELVALKAELRKKLTATDRIQVEQEKSTVLDQLKGLADSAKQAAVQAASSTGDLVANALQTAKQKIADAIQSAKANMVKLGNDLSVELAKLMAKLHKTGQGGPQLSDAMKSRLAELITRVGKGEADNLTFKLAGELSNQINQAGLGSKQTASTVEDRIKARIQNLIDLFQKGSLSEKGFRTKLGGVIGDLGASAKIIQKTEGVAAADRFRADLKALVEQAHAIAVTPGARSPAEQLAPKIIKPLEVIRQQDSRIAAAAARQRRAQLTEQRKHTKLLQKIAASQPSKKDSQALRDLIDKQNKAATDANTAANHRHNH